MRSMSLLEKLRSQQCETAAPEPPEPAAETQKADDPIPQISTKLDVTLPSELAATVTETGTLEYTGFVTDELVMVLRKEIDDLNAELIQVRRETLRHAEKAAEASQRATSVEFRAAEKIKSLEATNTSLRADVADKEGTITELRARIAAMEDCGGSGGTTDAETTPVPAPARRMSLDELEPCGDIDRLTRDLHLALDEAESMPRPGDVTQPTPPQPPASLPLRLVGRLSPRPTPPSQPLLRAHPSPTSTATAAVPVSPGGSSYLALYQSARRDTPVSSPNHRQPNIAVASRVDSARPGARVRSARRPRPSQPDRTFSNAKIVLNALRRVLAGNTFDTDRQAAIDALHGSVRAGTPQFAVALASSKSHKYRALYTVIDGELVKAHGAGPERVDIGRIEAYFKYDCGQKVFHMMQVSGLTHTVAAVALARRARTKD